MAADTVAAAGETALIAVIGEAEPVVERWRQLYDSSAAEGVPAHVTVLYPFLDRARIDADLRAELAAICARHPRFTVRFRRCGRFTETLYLAPEPAGPFSALTASLTGRWPQCQPYGGQHAEVIPHLTVADRQPSRLLDEAEAAVTPQLPVVSTVTAVALYGAAADGRWTSLATFPLG